jgi:hypothetical protein
LEAPDMTDDTRAPMSDAEEVPLLTLEPEDED